MADDGMDPCECLWNHELAMRRLLSLLRQGQSYCTDGECLEQYPALPPAATAAGENFLMVFLVMAMAVVLYVLRPRRARIADVSKPTNPSDRDDAPPNPPAIN